MKVFQSAQPYVRRMRSALQRPRKAALLLLPLACLAFGARLSASHADRVAERYVLPITPPADQANTGLCWVFATLSMIETNYMQRHPGQSIQLSRAALQRDAIKDRFHRRIRGEPGEVGDGGLAVEALALIRANGLVERDDFHDIVASEPVIVSIGQKLADYSAREEKQRALRAELEASLGPEPEATHLGATTLTPGDLAKAVLGGKRWVEFDLARDGVEGWGASHDPDARPDTLVSYVTLDRLVGLIHESLKRGEAVVSGTKDHALLIYGADYDNDGEPITYLIKDSLAPYVYRMNAEAVHAELNDVTVSMDAAGAV